MKVRTKATLVSYKLENGHDSPIYEPKEAEFEMPENPVQPSHTIQVVDGKAYLFVTWIELTPGERAELQMQQMRAQGKGGLVT